MRNARVYSTPIEFADMMRKHLAESMKVSVESDQDEPLLLRMKRGNEDLAQISLHNTFQTYMNTGDMNAAIDYLNGVISASMACENEEEIVKMNPSNIYPALRDTRLLEEGAKDMGLITDTCLPGLHVVYLELKRGFSKLINSAMIERHPRLTEEKVRKAAYRNLRFEGWTPPNLVMQSPFRESCTVEVYMENPFPVECQFLCPDMAEGNMPDQYLISFPNRSVVLIMRSTEQMNTQSAAVRLGRLARFKEIVRRSHLVMRHPVSDRIYWVNHGEFQLLEGIK